MTDLDKGEVLAAGADSLLSSLDLKPEDALSLGLADATDDAAVEVAWDLSGVLGGTPWANLVALSAEGVLLVIISCCAAC